MSLATMAFGMVFLLWILAILFQQRGWALGPALFTQMTPPPGFDGGLANFIVGSLMSSGRHLHRHTGRHSGRHLSGGDRAQERHRRVTRFINDILLSAPSIVIGLVRHTLIVANASTTRPGRVPSRSPSSRVPVIVRQTENMLQLVPEQPA